MSNLNGDTLAMISMTVNVMLTIVVLSVKLEVAKLRSHMAEHYISKQDFDRLFSTRKSGD